MTEPGVELEVIEAQPLAPANLFGAADPSEVVLRATQHAEALADVIRAKHLYKTIGQKNHVLVEGWTLLGSMLGVFPVVVWTRPLENGWEARVEARTLAGAVVGAAEAECLRSEKTWANRDDYAVRSMAQTRATSKALRGPLGFIVALAGYNPTPADEIPTGDAKPAAPGRKASQAQHAKLNAMCADLDANENTRRTDGQTWEDYSRHLAAEMFGVETRADLTTGQMAQLIDRVEAESVPF